MTTFFWVPFDDSDWNHDVYCRSIPAHGKILPHADGSVGFVGHENVSWSQVQANDTLVLAAHGKKWSTDEVAWRKKDGTIVQWSPTVFAQAIRAQCETLIPDELFIADTGADLGIGGRGGAACHGKREGCRHGDGKSLQFHEVSPVQLP